MERQEQCSCGMVTDVNDLSARFAKLSPGQPSSDASYADDSVNYNYDHEDRGGRRSPTLEELIVVLNDEANDHILTTEDKKQIPLLLEESKSTLQEYEANGLGHDGKLDISQGATPKGAPSPEEDVTDEELQAVLDDLGDMDEETPDVVHDGGAADVDRSHVDTKTLTDHDEITSRLSSLRSASTSQDDTEFIFPAAPSTPISTKDPSDIYFPSASTTDVATPLQSRTAKAASSSKDEDADEWCIICCANAEVQCLGCEGDLYCQRCWTEGHRGVDAGYEERGHRCKGFERRKRKVLVAG